MCFSIQTKELTSEIEIVTRVLEVMANIVKLKTTKLKTLKTTLKNIESINQEFGIVEDIIIDAIINEEDLEDIADNIVLILSDSIYDTTIQQNTVTPTEEHGVEFAMEYENIQPTLVERIPCVVTELDTEDCVITELDTEDCVITELDIEDCVITELDIEENDIEQLQEDLEDTIANTEDNESLNTKINNASDNFTSYSSYLENPYYNGYTNTSIIINNNNTLSDYHIVLNKIINIENALSYDGNLYNFIFSNESFDNFSVFDKEVINNLHSQIYDFIMLNNKILMYTKKDIVGSSILYNLLTNIKLLIKCGVCFIMDDIF